MIVLVTDYGICGPYLGQLEAEIAQLNPSARVINLFADAPAHKPKSTAYLIPAYASHFPVGTIFLCVIDPGVGTEIDEPVALEADGSWFVGPHNGLFDVVVSRARAARMWRLLYDRDAVSRTFHGRDVYAPAAARLDLGGEPAMTPLQLPDVSKVPPELDEIVYIDHFGNAMLGRRAGTLSERSILIVEGHELGRRMTFGEAEIGTAFWYENSNGLIEIAVNRGRASDILGLRVGDRVEVR